MVKHEADLNGVRRSRILKARWFMRDRQEFLANVARDIARLIKRAKKKGRKLCIRLNGATDIAYEGLRLTVSVDLARVLSKLSGTRIKPRESVTLFDLFPKTQFVDYTKNAARMLRDLPRNYHLTFSRSETNEEQCRQVLNAGGSVAAVFRGSLPKQYLGVRVIDGDKHDLRHKDPRGVVVGLLPKGLKAKRDTSGFVIPLAA